MGQVKLWYLQMFEKGCSALPEELEKNTAPWKSLNEIVSEWTI